MTFSFTGIWNELLVIYLVYWFGGSKYTHSVDAFIYLQVEVLLFSVVVRSCEFVVCRGRLYAVN